jgi:hypothetical protein
MWRVGLPTFAAAVVTSGIAVAINYATSDQNNVWAWAIVGALTLASAGASVWLYRQQEGSEPVNVPGTANVNVQRKSQVEKIRTRASGNANVGIGPRSHIGTLDVDAGIRPPREDPGPGERGAK